MASKKEPRTRSAAEKVRIQQDVQTLRAMLDSVEIALKIGGLIGADIAGAFMNNAANLVMRIAKHDAFDQYEEDAKHRGSGPPQPCLKEFTDTAPGQVSERKKLVCKEAHRCPTCFAIYEQWVAAHQRSAF